MLRSMTGYGRGEATTRDVTVVVELRSVNNRFCDVQLRAPRAYLPIEPRVHKLLKERFSRGRIDAFVRRSVESARSVVRTDRALAREYLDALHGLASELTMAGSTDISLSYIASQPGVLVVIEAEEDVVGEWSVLEVALESAANDLLNMRETEGRALFVDLQHHLSELRATVGEVEVVTAGINERLKHRLEVRIRRLLEDRFDLQRIEQEAAILADKADVSEEIARLRSHTDQFAETLESDEPVGRRLDFLLQEMNREVNTIGSKAAEHPVSHRVVHMKSILERMREQAANVE